MFWKISQNSQENTCARVSFLIKLRLEACNLKPNEWRKFHWVSLQSGGLEHFLSELLWLESLFGNTAYLQDKVFVWIRKVFLAFSCNLDDIKRPNGTSREQGNKCLFSLIKLLNKVFQICIILSIINSNFTRRNFEIKL